MRYRIAVCLLAVVFALSACNLSSTGGGAETVGTATAASSLPVVTILSPTDGTQVPNNQQILVSANANDPIGITRVQLFANGNIVKTVSSETPGGDTNLNVLLDYTPTADGTLNLQVIAYRGAVASDPAQITLTVVENTPQATITQSAPVIVVPPINPYDPTCRVLVNTPLNFRTGPGTVYDRISLLATGTVAPITGRTGDNSWYQVRVGYTTGWVSGSFVTLYGNCQNVGIPPIPPTPTPFFTPTYLPTSTLTLTPQLPTSTATPGLPDLVVTNLSLVGGSCPPTCPSTLSLGGNPSVTGTFSVTVTNTGAGPSAQFNNTITVTLPPNPGTTLPLGVVASLNPGESIVLNTDLTFNATGTYTIQVVGDSDSQVTEVSEVNNTASMTLTVTP